ncbi:MAG: NAD(P)H-dependent oxidoreductase [Gordonia paraffinivorans]
MTSPRRALLVHAHPEPSSFSSAQADAAAAALADRGLIVDRIDLHADRWQPVLDRHEFPAATDPFKPQAEQMRAVAAGTLAADVRHDLDRLLAADLLVLSFPLWWFSVPAILKGWIDRVFVMGATFGGDLGLFEAAAFAGRQAVLSVTTGGSPASFARGGAFGAIEDFLYPIHRGVLEFVGYRVLPPVLTYGPAHLDDDDRAEALHAVSEAFAAIGDCVARTGDMTVTAQSYP